MIVHSKSALQVLREVQLVSGLNLQQRQSNFKFTGNLQEYSVLNAQLELLVLDRQFISVQPARLHGVNFA